MSDSTRIITVFTEDWAQSVVFTNVNNALDFYDRLEGLGLVSGKNMFYARAVSADDLINKIIEEGVK